MYTLCCTLSDELNGAKRTMNTLYFPEEYNLEPIIVDGPTPVVGSRIYISNWDAVELNSRYDHRKISLPHYWIVKRIDYGVRVWGNDSQRVKNIINGPAKFKIDVILEKGA